MIKITSVEWRTGEWVIGFVLCFDNVVKKYKAYMGVSEGIDAKADAILIRDYGTKMKFVEAKGFFPHLIRKEYAWK